jgi:hypothetical protein
VRAQIDRGGRRAKITILGPKLAPPADADAIQPQAAWFWPLRSGTRAPRLASIEAVAKSVASRR